MKTEEKEMETITEFVNDFFNNRVHVVRCKDCKHRPTPDEKGRGIAPGADDCYDFGVDRTCPWLCDDGYYSRIPPDDFFCAYGEAKNGKS